MGITSEVHKMNLFFLAQLDLVFSIFKKILLVLHLLTCVYIVWATSPTSPKKLSWEQSKRIFSTDLLETGIYCGLCLQLLWPHFSYTFLILFISSAFLPHANTAHRNMTDTWVSPERHKDTV
jgi:hypothetical protein